jgi:hypothetical protein
MDPVASRFSDRRDGERYLADKEEFRRVLDEDLAAFRRYNDTPRELRNTLDHRR